MQIKFKKTTIFLIIIFFIGLSLSLYPSFSNYWNEKNATHAINSYAKQLETVDEEQYEQLWADAVNYNKDLLERKNPCKLTDELKNRYQSNIDISGNGLMGYIDIPRIGVSLPIYHGTSKSVLQHAVGHIDWSSLPVGGESTHCVLSGHRGLPNAKLFTDLDQMREGDIFTMNVLNETLTYQVDQIRTVDPDETSELLINKGMDYCTLVTCTPYGINTHRLLVRGHRIENAQAGVTVISEVVVINPLIVAACLAVPLLFALFLMVMLKKPENNKNKIDLKIEEDNE